MAQARLGVDVGGTFTDLVLVSEGRITTTKVLSTPADQSVGVIKAWEASGADAGDVAAFAHGMTVATNALLERRGAKTALVTTRGFRDVIEIARQDRASLYDLTAHAPAPLVPRERRLTVDERMGPHGVLRPLRQDSVLEVVQALAGMDVEAVAVCLLFAFAHPEHEAAVASAIRNALPGLHVTTSAEVLPEFREYERFSTTVADAYLTPLLGRYIRLLHTRSDAAGLGEPMVMQSSGGVVPASAAADHAAGFALSGPAGGVVGAAHVARLSGFTDLLTFDMGGTSTDVALVEGGVARTTTESVVAGVPLRLPMVDVHTVSAGGGSIAWVDAGGALRVGPRSAGAVPGPACYGRGGAHTTVTDANLLLGILDDQARLGDDDDAVVLDRSLAAGAVERLAHRLGMDTTETAEGVLRVAEAEMVRALRVMSVQRGVDPRALTLVAFGGAGGLHACALAEEMGISTVLVPRAAGVLSALGLAASGLRRDLVRPLLAPLESLDPTQVATLVAEMSARAAEDLDSPHITVLADVRYVGQSFELTVAAEPLTNLAERFHSEHERRYGYRMDDQPSEAVAVRVVAEVPVSPPTLHEDPAAGPVTAQRRSVVLDGRAADVPVVQRSTLGSGATLIGPCIVEFADSTCLVRSGWSGAVDATGTMVLERS